jgi:hypothetical protein
MPIPHSSGLINTNPQHHPMTQATQTQSTQELVKWRSRAGVIKHALKYLALIDDDTAVLTRQGKLTLMALSYDRTTLMIIEVKNATINTDTGVVIKARDIAKLAKDAPWGHLPAELIIRQDKALIRDATGIAAAVPAVVDEGVISLVNSITLNREHQAVLTGDKWLLSSILKPFAVLPAARAVFKFTHSTLMLRGSIDDGSHRDAVLLMNVPSRMFREYRISGVFEVGYNVGTLVKLIEEAWNGVISIGASPGNPLEAVVDEGEFTVRLFTAPFVE